MSKVSIALRGWRFDETAVFDENGSFRPLEEMPPDTRTRLNRLTALVNRPCDACWQIHGDEEIKRCTPAAVVYGEPMAEVILCDAHEPDFVFWFHEAGGAAFRGTDELDDAFEEWFSAGGRAPEDYGSVTHVDTDPDTLPTPDELLAGGGGKIGSGEPFADRTTSDDPDEDENQNADDPVDDGALENVDFSREYPQ